MCGLVGMMGDIPQNYKQIFNDMLDVGQLRGRHSTGVLKVDQRDQDYTWFKRVGPPAYLRDSKDYEKTIEQGLVGILAGHLRHKTVGEISTATAHPFDFEEAEICGMHNGTLRNYIKLSGHEAGNVDSETLYATLVNEGVEETFSQLEGAWACVWWNGKQKTLNFIRNDQRTLYFTWNKDRRVMFWASEAWMLNAVARKIDLWDGGKEGKVFVSLPINTLWSFKMDCYAPRIANTDRKVITMQPIRKIEPLSPANAGNSSGSAGKRGGWKWNPKKKTSVRVVEKGDGTTSTVTSEKGGEVSDPFQQDGDDRERLDEWLKNNETPLPGAAGSTTTAGAKEESPNSSSKSTGSSTEPKKSTKSRKPILSLVQTTSSSSPKTSKKSSPEKSGESTKSSGAGSLFPPRTKQKYVDVRNVLGNNYITDMKTRSEYPQEIFEKNTKGVCYFCETPIGDLTEVGEFLSPTKFICTSCQDDCSTPSKKVG